MKGLKEEKAGVVTARKEPMDIGIPSAVVFLIKNGIGLCFLSSPPSSISLELSSILRGEDWSILNRSGVTTIGARDLVVSVLEKLKLIKLGIKFP